MAKKQLTSRQIAALQNVKLSEVVTWPDALNKLISALRIYIQVDDEEAKHLLQADIITYAQYDAGQSETNQLRVLLQRLEEHQLRCMQSQGSA